MTSKNELKIQKQRSAALRRLGFFVLILLGCAVLSVLFSYELKTGTGKLSSRFIDVGTLNEEADASSAFSWSRLLIGHSADMLTKLLICVSIFIYGVAIFIISFVATAILSLSGVRKKSHVASLATLSLGSSVSVAASWLLVSFLQPPIISVTAIISKIYFFIFEFF